MKIKPLTTKSIIDGRSFFGDDDRNFCLYLRFVDQLDTDVDTKTYKHIQNIFFEITGFKSLGEVFNWNDNPVRTLEEVNEKIEKLNNDPRIQAI